MTTTLFRPRSFFTSAAARWAAIYTFGLPRSARERRLQQVESDIWEQEAEGVRDGLAPARLGFDIFERTVRGIPADILWRFQLEGPKVNINIPIERVAGALLLVLIVLVIGGTSISGYDPARDTWAGELERMGDNPAWQTDANVIFWMLCGLALLGVATAFYRAVQLASPALALLEAFSFAAAGVLVLISAAMYRSMLSLAVEFKDNPAEPGLIASSRSLMVAIETLQFGIIALLTVGVFSFALATHRQRLVPGWLSRLAAVSVVLLVASFASSVAEPLDTTSWILMMSGLLSMTAWLVIAGAVLLINRKPSIPSAPAPSPA